MLTNQEALTALKEADTTGQRSRQAYGYAHASPFFILWGVVWIIGYGGTGMLTGAGPGYLWLVLDLAGVLGSIWIGSRATRRSEQKQDGRFKYRFIATFLAIGLFIGAVELVMAPHTGEQQGAFAALLVALFYGLMGVWQGVRFLVAGIVVMALTLGGFFFLHDHFFPWMAAVGGGALILAGLWLRKV